MSLLTDITPLNLLTEKEKFFADFSYNPQFEYARSIAAEELTQQGHPQQNLYEFSFAMVQNGRPETEYAGTMSEADIQTALEKFQTQYQLPQKIQLHFSENFTVRCRIDHFDMSFQLPITYTPNSLGDLLRHEVETHLFRRLNHQMQPWKNELQSSKDFRRTEEGLAGLHTYLYRSEKVTRKSFRMYITIYLAEHDSFSHVFQKLIDLHVPPKLAWQATLRAKRGLTDTSQAGAFTKDICYLEGMIAVWRWLMNEANDPKDLYLGRIGLTQLAAAKQTAVTTGLYYPHFFDDLPLYHQHIREIGEANHFAEVT